MQASEFQELAFKTASKDYYLSSISPDLLHAGIGIATEAGEFLDAIKKAAFYGKYLDRINLAEELGDLMWYIALAATDLGVDLEEVMETNINKLKIRYPKKFTQDSALNRDLEAERKVLGG